MNAPMNRAGDVTERLKLVADMRPGQLFPPEGMPNPEEWHSNWGIPLSRLLYEARAEILTLRIDAAINNREQRFLAVLVSISLWVNVGLGLWLVFS